MQDTNMIEKRLAFASRLHTILGVFGILLTLFFCVGAWFGHVKSDEPRDVKFILDLVTILGAVGSLLLSVGLIVVGGAIRRRQHHALCVVVSVLLCPCIPFGTAVGAYSLYVLLDQNTKKLFGE